MIRVAGIVLCGGKSSRMGYPKALLPFGDELLLQRVVRVVSTIVTPVAVVSAADQSLPKLPDDVLLAIDRKPSRGPLEGLRAGLSAIADHADAAFVTSCDAPFVSQHFIHSMIDMLGEHEIAIPMTDDFAHPMAAVYRTSVMPHVNELLATDQLRPFFLLKRVRTRVVNESELSAVDPSLASLRNMNQPQDYINALTELGLELPDEMRTVLGIA